MPNRIVRDAILASEPVASLSWPEEVFYRRLMSVVDDYGRCEAIPQLLRSRCYPLQVDLVRVADISRWMAACQKAGLIVLYGVDDKQYLELVKFGQQQRSPSKYPPPPSSASKCSQTIANAHLGVVVSVVEDVGVKGADEPPPTASPAIASLPLNNGSEFPLTEAHRDEYAALYPAVDVPQQFREMRAWALANPTKRKTAGGVLRFVNAWLSREQDKGGQRPSANAPRQRKQL